MNMIVAFSSAAFAAIAAVVDTDPAAFVDPFIGTLGTGHVTPAAARPFGFVQAGPDTGNFDWKYCSGYQYSDETLYGFSQNHLSGTGCASFGDVLILPFIGETPDRNRPVAFDKRSERAEPGYYAVTLGNGIRCEAAAAAHSVVWRFTYPKGTKAKLLVDLQWQLADRGAFDLAKRVKQCDVGVENGRVLVGEMCKDGWARRIVGFHLETDCPKAALERLPALSDERAPRYAITCDLGGRETLVVRVALSSVDRRGAKRNFAAEIAGRGFDEIRADARAEWNRYLSRFKVESDDRDALRAFYTSVYHLCFQPNDIADVDGRYRGTDWLRIHQAKGGRHFSTLSIWDTFRAAHPLYTLVTPELVDGMVESMLAMGEQYGLLPIWALWGQETQGMIGTHSVPVIVDAYLKGFRGFDADRAMALVDKSLREFHHWRGAENWDLLDFYGYYPCDLVRPAAVSRSLECFYDDACSARLAKALGRKDSEEFYSKRAAGWTNLFDSATKTMRGRDSAGRWREPFDPYFTSYSGDYTEANARQYTWHVLQEPEKLVEAFGGKEPFVRALDDYFTDTHRCPSNDVLDATGLIGQYAHGNEPSHHVAYLYQYGGRGDRTAAIVREVIDRFYRPQPDGLCGNDDCGQMSAWYLFSAMGFYPLDPCGGEYVIGSPQFPAITLDLANGARFRIVARNLSKSRKYVKSVKLNGRPLDGFIIRHADIVKGGELVFEMTDGGHEIEPFKFRLTSTGYFGMF